MMLESGGGSVPAVVGSCPIRLADEMRKAAPSVRSVEYRIVVILSILFRRRDAMPDKSSVIFPM